MNQLNQINSFGDYKAEAIIRLEDRLGHWLQAYLAKDAIGALGLDESLSETLNQAMAYSVLNGGKRARSLLLMAAAKLSGRDHEVTDLACAVEMVHAYSLIHDDLPAMDDDELRRGKPTCHIKFDEATAILAGDALQAFAFEILAQSRSFSDQEKIWQVATLARAIGPVGMVAGQMLDIDAENKTISQAELELVHRFKTGQLIMASLELGAGYDFCHSDKVKHLIEFGKAIGLAFQVQDDVLDVISNTEQLGKPQGSDQAQNKSTYVKLMGLEQARQYANKLIDHAEHSLKSIDSDHKAMLISICHWLKSRTY